MTKGEHVCHFRRHNCVIMTRSKLCFLYAHVHCMSKLFSKFEIPTSNTLGGVAEAQIVLQCVMLKICYHSGGHNSAMMSWVKTLFP